MQTQSKCPSVNTTTEVALLDLKRRLKAVLDLLGCIAGDGFTLSRGRELHIQWRCILRHGPSGPLTWDDLGMRPEVGLDLSSLRGLRPLFGGGSEFILKDVDLHGDFAFRGWRNWVLEDPLAHTFKWRRPDLVHPFPFLSCDPGLTPGGSGVLVDLVKIDEHIRKAWLPFFCRGTRGNADLDAFRRVAEDLTPMLDEVELPPLIGPMLFEGVLRKKAHSW